MDVVKANALEVDTKLRFLQKKVVNFVCGYVPEDNNQIGPAKQLIASSQDSLERLEKDCMEFNSSTDNLESLILEAEATADKIYARLSEMYADCRLEMPHIEKEELPIGIPLNKLILGEPEDECSLISENVTDGSIAGNSNEDTVNNTGSGNTTESEAEEFRPNIFISRPSGKGGPPSWTPMIKARKIF